MPRPNAAVLAARKRRAAKATEKSLRIEWFIKEVSDKVEMTVRQRVKISTELVKSRVVTNISKPVQRLTGPKGGKIVRRSKPGEYPRADTTMLMKSIVSTVKTVRRGVYDGLVGTTLDYGVILETSTRLNRGFLRRSLKEMLPNVKRILTGPVKRSGRRRGR